VGLIVGIDIGGTFTDTVVMDEAGRVETFKSFSTPQALLEGFLENVRLAAGQRGLDPATFLTRVERITHGTTVATNAFIERRGARVGLLTTRGFEDGIVAQRMMGMTAGLSRSEVTDYARRAAPLPLCPVTQIFGIRERVDFAGRVVAPLVEDDVADAARSLGEAGVDAVAICFLWSFKNPVHEQRAEEIVRRVLRDAYVVKSVDVAPVIGEYERTATTVVSGYLGPLIARYTTRLEDNLEAEGARPRVLLLDSAGGAITPLGAAREPARLLMSGPAGGMTASEHLGELLGHRNIITFDMGGTSCDVGLIVDDVVVKRTDTVIGKYHLRLPMTDIQTIGAGGGSIARAEGAYLRVGPESAGAEPGPACYGRGGLLPTVTDADVVLGIVNPRNFLGGRVVLDEGAARHALEEHVAAPLGLSTVEAAAGIKRIIDQRMLDLVRTVTIERGYDPREFVLYAYGGAGASHAPAFALDLVSAVVVPRTHSVHSALGAVASDLSFVTSRSTPMATRPGVDGFVDVAEEVRTIFGQLEERSHALLDQERVPPERRRLSRIVQVRYARQTKELPVEWAADEVAEAALMRLLKDFEVVYARRYGHEAVPEQAGFELVTFTVEARGLLARPVIQPAPKAAADAAVARTGRRPAFDPLAGGLVETDIFDGGRLGAGHRLAGPAILEYEDTTVAVCRGQVATVDAYGNVVITRQEG
jgi:N-methylhydantoinase A